MGGQNDYREYIDFQVGRISGNIWLVFNHAMCYQLVGYIISTLRHRHYFLFLSVSNCLCRLILIPQWVQIATLLYVITGCFRKKLPIARVSNEDMTCL